VRMREDDHPPVTVDLVTACTRGRELRGRDALVGRVHYLIKPFVLVRDLRGEAPLLWPRPRPE